MDKHHRDILRSNHSFIVNTLDLSESFVLDQLFEDDVISSGEQEYILSHTTKREQNYKLLSLLKRKGSSKNPYGSLLNALSVNYSYVAEKLTNSEKDQNQDGNPARTTKNQCANCLLLRNLEPIDISHSLYENEVLTDDDLDFINNRNFPRNSRARKLLDVLDANSNSENLFSHVLASLREKYIDLVDENTTLDSVLYCSCGEQISGLNPAFRDLQVDKRRNDIHCCENTDRSTDTQDDNTYKTNESKLLQTTYHTWDDGDKHGGSFLGRISECASKNLQNPLGGSTTGTCEKDEQKLENKAVFPQKPSCRHSDKKHRKDNKPPDAISPDHDSLVTKFQRSKVSQTRKRTRSRQEHERILENLTDSSHCVTALQHVSKYMPNDKKLMRLCSKLWDELFFLREKGDWVKFKLLTDGALEKYKDKPDVQVLLYRSEMCISTFYKNDPEKSETMFNNAMELIPKTSIPSWHLSRLLPLKMELYTRCQNFEEAEKLLKEAHQVMATLAPCLSTGAVYFFEAMYLGAILRCSRSGTRYEAISKRVKDCFITAIQHYEQEPFFGIKSFLNQVYLFLASFSLGVDFKKISYIEFQRISENDVALAEHYLNLFENEFWEISTNWSRMLFYIGRSEQHKQRGNFQRCLDYLSDAKECAMLGQFEEHANFIENNVLATKQKQEEQLKMEELRDRSIEAILNGLSSDSSD